MLFLDALYSYLVTKFARIAKLQTPCPLCSRLDHLFGNEKPGFYKDLICKSHISEISSLAFCHIHQKLADVHEMCESCLLSFATEKKSNPETYRSLVGILGSRLEDTGEDPLWEKETYSDSVRTRICSCCSISFSNQAQASKFLQGQAAEEQTETEDILLHIAPEKEKVRSNLNSSTYDLHGHPGFDRLSHAGYNKLRINSDTESEVLLSDDDNKGAQLHGSGDFMLNVTQSLSPELVNKGLIPPENENVKSTVASPSPTYNHHEHPGFDSLFHVGYSELKINSDSESETQLSDDDDRSSRFHGSDDLMVNVTQPLLPEHVDKDLLANVAPSLPAELVSLGFEVSPVSISTQIPSEKLSHPGPDMLGPSVSFTKEAHDLEDHSDLANLVDGVATDHRMNGPDCCPIARNANPPASSDVSVPELLSEGLNTCSPDADAHDVECISETKSVHIATGVGSDEFKIDQNIGGQNLSAHITLDLNDAYMIAVGSRGSNMATLSVTDVITGRDSSRVHEDLRLLLSQISSTKGLEIIGNDIVPSPRLFNASSSAVLENITKRLSIERNESGLESLDGSMVSEIEGESPLDRLKRQIELDRKSISILYKELEEERNASAVAAHQAMAMITRLQEEKAAMQMEALQYQRMMEEQAEYDEEAVQKANELLSQREKEMQDLQAELESYRKRYKGEAENKIEDKEILTHESLPINNGHAKDHLFEFESEKLYISESLKKLEKRLHLFSNNDIYVDPVVTNDVHDTFIDGQYSEEAVSIDGSEHAYMDTDSSTEAVHCKTPSLSPQHRKVKDTKFSLHVNDEPNSQSSFGNQDGELAAFGKEILDLNERLKTLEADRDFLEHAINSLRDGNDGMHFIQEIACHLRSLRKIGISRGEDFVS